jgi:hypothetical protein
MSGAGKPGGQAASPVDFERTWLVSEAGGVGAVHHASIGAVISAIKALPLAEQPSFDAPHVIEVLSGNYPELIWLPDWVWIKGPALSVATLEGPAGSGTGKAIISVGLGGAENISVISAMSPDAEVGIFLRNTSSAYTEDESDFGTIDNGDTLIVTPKGQSQETFTFAGTETTAQNVVDLINATAVNLLAKVRFGRVELIHVDPRSNGLIIHKEGTVNAALGFSTAIDLNTDPPALGVQFLRNIVVFTGIKDGILYADRTSGTFLTNDVIIAGAQVNGIHVESQCTSLAVARPLLFLNSNGLNLESGSTLNVDGGRSILNTTEDVVIDVTATLIASGFTYSERPSTGTLVPAGTRITFIWNVVGNIGVGTLVDGGRVAPFDMTIESISLWRGIAGTPATSLIVDLNKAGSGSSPLTLYTTQANRPKITSDGTNNVAIVATLPDQLNVLQGEFLSMDIDSAETGLSQNMNLIVTAVVN